MTRTPKEGWLVRWITTSAGSKQGTWSQRNEQAFIIYDDAEKFAKSEAKKSGSMEVTIDMFTSQVDPYEPYPRRSYIGKTVAVKKPS